MTEPINERLAKILAKLSLSSHSSRYLDGENENEAKVAILTLFREVVEEAKPERKVLYHGYGWDSDNQRIIGRNQGADEYEANLLQQLGDKK